MSFETALESQLERKSGIAIWRQIADNLRQEISSGALKSAARLPSEIDLAKRFEVNRHTVRVALNALAKEGMVESRQGQGTFVLSRNHITYPIGRRTRFSDGVSDQVSSTYGTLLDHAVEIAPSNVAHALKLAPGKKAVRLETISEADGVPLSRATSWFSHDDFPDIAAAYGETGSITRALAMAGVSDYLRKSTLVEARHVSAQDADALRLSPGAIVLITEAINTNLAHETIQFSRARFAADRIKLAIENER